MMDTFNSEFSTIEQRDLFPFLNNDIFGDASHTLLNQSSPSNSESSPLSSPHQNILYSAPLDGNLPANSIDPKNLLFDDDMLIETRGLKRPHPESDDEGLDVAHMSAAEIKELKAKLSPEDLKEIKKKRRKLKNRESAQLSRQRKKLYVDELEQKVDVLATKNKDLTCKVSTLSTENKSLKEEVDRLQNLVKQSSALNSVFENVQNIKKNQQVSSNVKAAGVCLAIVLFSFGLFFNEAPQGNAIPASNVGSTNVPTAMTGALNPLQSGNYMFSPDQMTIGTSSSSSVSRGARVLNSLSSDDNDCESSESGSDEQSNNAEKNCIPKSKRTGKPVSPTETLINENKTNPIVPTITTTTTTTTTTPVAPVITTSTVNPTPVIPTSIPSLDPFGSVSGLARGLSSLSGSLISDFARTQIPSKKSHIFWAEAFKIAGNENEESSLLLVPLTSQNKMLSCGLDS